jgi:hypothetical protein
MQAVAPARAVAGEPHVIDALLLDLVARGGAVEVGADLVDAGDGAAQQAEACEEGGDRDRVRHRIQGIR